MTTDPSFLRAHRQWLEEPEPRDLDRDERIEDDRGDYLRERDADRKFDEEKE